MVAGQSGHGLAAKVSLEDALQRPFHRKERRSAGAGGWLSDWAEGAKE